jgi:hypothetical protein
MWDRGSLEIVWQDTRFGADWIYEIANRIAEKTA